MEDKTSKIPKIIVKKKKKKKKRKQLSRFFKMYGRLEVDIATF